MAPGTSATSSNPYARRSRVEVASGEMIAGSINNASAAGVDRV
jgi:hypothetical protein